VTEAHRQAMEAWMASHPAIAGPKVGPLVDAWRPEEWS
jgi:uncharacterized protein YggL (DUF469 family)